MKTPQVNTGLPHFLCIGAQKAGTSWLWSMLRQNPGIWMPPIKELHYFDHLFFPEDRGWIEKGLFRRVKRLLASECRQAKNIDLEQVRYLLRLAGEAPFTEGWYFDVFSHPEATGKILGEITPAYCAIGPDGVDYMTRLLSTVKIIYLIRDPLDRALSQLRMTIQRSKTFVAGAAESWDKVANDPALDNRGDYAEYVPLWVELMGKNNVLFLPFGDIVRRPLELLRRVERFLGCVEVPQYAGLTKKVHKTESITIPAAVMARIEERTRVQRDFLEGYFGHEFLVSIK